MTRIPELWQGIETWLTANAPEIAQSLRPGATDEQIQAFEAKTGVTLPEQWRELYRLHDGQENTHTAIMDLQWYPLANVAQVWVNWRDVLTEGDGDAQKALSPSCTSTPDGAIRKQYINLKWVPAFTTTLDSIGPDLDPGHAGQVGQVINFGRDQLDKYVMARDLEGFLGWMLHAMQGGEITVQTASTGDAVIRLKGTPFEAFSEDLKILCQNGPLDERKD